MNKSVLFFGLVFIILLSHSNTMADGFPTKQGNAFISIGMDYSHYFDYDDDQRATFRGAFGVMMFTDIAVGIRAAFNRRLFKYRDFSDIEIGPQLIWFVGGTMHRKKIVGSIYHYFGISVFERFRTKHSRQWISVDSFAESGATYYPGNYQGMGYQLSFGLGAGVSNSSVLFGEFSLSGANDEYKSSPNGNTGIGLVLYHYFR